MAATRLIVLHENKGKTIAEEFLLSKRNYDQKTGKRNNVLGYQIRQSFLPGEITPEEANQVGYELAMRFTKGRHAFTVSTHTDKTIYDSLYEDDIIEADVDKEVIRWQRYMRDEYCQ